jgi:hypothetical protein
VTAKNNISLATAPAGFREFLCRGDDRDGRNMPMHCSFSVSANSARVCRGLPELLNFHAKFSVLAKALFSAPFPDPSRVICPILFSEQCKLQAIVDGHSIPPSSAATCRRSAFGYSSFSRQRRGPAGRSRRGDP